MHNVVEVCEFSWVNGVITSHRTLENSGICAALDSILTGQQFGFKLGQRVSLQADPQLQLPLVGVIALNMLV
jgi:hypothetical protein